MVLNQGYVTVAILLLGATAVHSAINGVPAENSGQPEQQVEDLFQPQGAFEPADLGLDVFVGDLIIGFGDYQGGDPIVLLNLSV